MISIRFKRFAWAGLAFFVACSSSAQQPNRVQGLTDVVATVGSVSITLAEGDQKAMQQPASEFGQMKLVLALYEARRAAIDEIVGERLIADEAKTRGTNAAELVDAEITSKIVTVSEADIVACSFSRLDSSAITSRCSTTSISCSNNLPTMKECNCGDRNR